MLSRRELFLAGAGTALGAAALAGARPAAAAETEPPAPPPANLPYTPVVTPNGSPLPWKLRGGVKVFHLVAEPVQHQFAAGLEAECWGYNGRVHGPTIEAVEGDRVRIYVTNKLPAPTTVHWHGLILPNGMDGVGGLNQRAIRPGETFKYEFELKQHGTFMYHSHHDEMTQMAMGLMGMIVVHPRRPRGPKVDRDFVLLLSEWKVVPGTRRPDPNEMSDFNILTMNAKAYPGTAPLVVRKGDRVRIRFGNLSAMDHHPIHLHGYEFQVTALDSGPVPEAQQVPQYTVLVPVATTRTIEFVADNPGDWAMHCHMTHHVMNQMGHELPNMVGMVPGDLDRRVQRLLPGYTTMGQDGMGDHGEHIEAGHHKVPENSIPMVGARGKHDYITMGGMFTILKVRERLRSYDEDPGWYENPPGTLAEPATAAELLADLGIAAAAGTSGAPAAESRYVCPMHPEVVQAAPGTCPKCGMDLVPAR